MRAKTMDTYYTGVLFLYTSLVAVFAWPGVGSQTYLVDDSVGLGRRFDGVGGLSGGGVSL